MQQPLREYLTEGYAAVAARHAANGFYVFGHDHVGHGRREGSRSPIGCRAMTSQQRRPPIGRPH